MTTAGSASIAPLLAGDFEWFWNLRSLRDYIVHDGATPNIACNGQQFHLWVYAPNRGWITREPLLPLLKWHIENLLSFADVASTGINQEIQMPDDRIRSRVVYGVLVPRLHKLIEVAGEYNDPSPKRA